MRFFAKVAIICNVCFILSVVLRLVDIFFQKKGKYDGALQLQPLKSTIIILGYGAIFVNLLFCMAFVLATFLRKKNKVLTWPNVANPLPVAATQKPLNFMAIICLFFLIIQVYYFFFSSI
jgi:hypothetical protein